MNLKEIGCRGLYCIHLDKYRKQRWNFVNMIIKIHVPVKWVSFWLAQQQLVSSLKFTCLLYSNLNYDLSLSKAE